MCDIAGKQILLVARHPVGGIRSYFREVCNDPAFSGVNFSILMPEKYVSDIKNNALMGNCVHAVSYKDNIDLVKQLWLLTTKHRFDIVHSHGFSAGLLSAIPLYLKRLPHLMTTHEILLNNQFQGFSGFFQKRVIDFGLRLISCTMAVSDDAKNNLKEFFPFFKKGKKLIVIKNGIDVKRFSTSSARNFYQELNLSDNFILFGFFGRFMNAKGFRYLVEAVQELKAQEVVNNIRVIAFGWGGFIREEQEYIRDLGLEDYFLFMPHTDDMPAAIRGVDAVVIPSLWEACPMLPMEVMVSGIPVIASDCIGLREVTAETPALVFQHGNAIELAAVMQRYIDEASQCHEDSLAYSTTAVGRYDVAITASELCAQYRLMM